MNLLVTKDHAGYIKNDYFFEKYLYAARDSELSFSYYRSVHPNKV